jgi:hypothetical protein
MKITPFTTELDTWSTFNTGFAGYFLLNNTAGKKRAFSD